MKLQKCVNCQRNRCFICLDAKMYHNNIILLAIVFFITCNSTKSLFVQNPKDVGHQKPNLFCNYDVKELKRSSIPFLNIGEGYFYMIGSMHALKKRDVYNTGSMPSGIKPNDETIIIMPNPGMNYPYSNYYPTNPVSRYGANSGTTVIVSNPDGNYNNGYGTKYIPNKYG